MDREKRIKEMKQARQKATPIDRDSPLSPPPKPKSLINHNNNNHSAQEGLLMMNNNNKSSNADLAKLEDKLNELKRKKELLEEKKKKQLEKRREALLLKKKKMEEKEKEEKREKEKEKEEKEELEKKEKEQQQATCGNSLSRSSSTSAIADPLGANDDEEPINDPLLSPRNNGEASKKRNPPKGHHQRDKDDDESSPTTTNHNANANADADDPTDKKKNGGMVGIKELSPATVTNMVNQFCNYLAVIVYSDGQLMAESSLSRVHELDQFFKWYDGRRVFASSLVMLLQKVPFVA